MLQKRTDMGQLSKAERDLLEKLMKAREGRDTSVKPEQGGRKDTEILFMTACGCGPQSRCPASCPHAGLSSWASLQAHIKLSGGVKKAKSKKGPGAKRRAKDLVDQFGCVSSDSSPYS